MAERKENCPEILDVELYRKYFALACHRPTQILDQYRTLEHTTRISYRSLTRPGRNSTKY